MATNFVGITNSDPNLLTDTGIPTSTASSFVSSQNPTPAANKIAVFDGTDTPTVQISDTLTTAYFNGKVGFNGVTAPNVTIQSTGGIALNFHAVAAAATITYTVLASDWYVAFTRQAQLLIQLLRYQPLLQLRRDIW